MIPQRLFTLSQSECGRKSLSLQSTAFSTGFSSSASVVGFVVVVFVLLVVVILVVVVVLLDVVVLAVVEVEVEASGTHWPSAGVVGPVLPEPSAEGVLGGRAQAG